MNFLNGAMTKARGFTFIELLIAVSIFAVVAIALYSTFFAGISVWKRSGEDGNIYQDARFVFDDITKDLKNSLYGGEDEKSAFAFSGNAQEIIFITLEPLFFEEDISRKELVKVAYSVDGEEGQLIRRMAGKSLGFDIEKAEKEILLKDVEEFTFMYCYDSGDEDEPYIWKEEWDDEKMRVPRGVKVSFSIKAEEGKKKAPEFSKIIFVPTGVLGEKELGL